MASSQKRTSVKGSPAGRQKRGKAPVSKKPGGAAPKPVRRARTMREAKQSWRGVDAPADVRDRLEQLIQLRGGAERFAEFVGVSKSLVSSYRSAERLPGAETLARIARRTGVSLDWLLLGERHGVEGDGPVSLTQTRSPQSLSDELAVYLAREVAAALGDVPPLGSVAGKLAVDADAVLRRAVEREAAAFTAWLQAYVAATQLPDEGASVALPFVALGGVVAAGQPEEAQRALAQLVAASLRRGRQSRQDVFASAVGGADDSAPVRLNESGQAALIGPYIARGQTAYRPLEALLNEMSAARSRTAATQPPASSLPYLRELGAQWRRDPEGDDDVGIAFMETRSLLDPGGTLEGEEDEEEARRARLPKRKAKGAARLTE